MFYDGVLVIIPMSSDRITLQETYGKSQNLVSKLRIQNYDFIRTGIIAKEHFLH